MLLSLLCLFFFSDFGFAPSYGGMITSSFFSKGFKFFGGSTFLVSTWPNKLELFLFSSSNFWYSSNDNVFGPSSIGTCGAFSSSADGATGISPFWIAASSNNSFGSFVFPQFLDPPPFLDTSRPLPVPLLLS